MSETDSKHHEGSRKTMKVMQLRVYMVAWSIHRVYEVIGAGNQTLEWHGVSQLSIVPLALLAVATRSIRFWILAMGATLVGNVTLMPFIWDSEYWCLQTDLTVMLMVMATYGWKHVLFSTKPLPASAEHLFDAIHPVIVQQMMLFYFAAFFWKLNWDFLDAHSSCAPIFAMQLLDHILPSFVVLPNTLSILIVQTSPYLVLLLEGYIAVAFFYKVETRKYGVMAAVLLHMGIAMCPPPSNVATFSLMCASRLVLLVPTGAVRAASTSAWSTLEVAGTVLATAITANIANHEDFYDLAYPLFTFVTPFVVKAALLEDTPDAEKAIRSVRSRAQKAVAMFAIVLSFTYSFLFIVLGLMDQGQPHMYANLRLHGGTNHIFQIPTSILQAFYQNAYHSTFAGGIVRIESSTLQILNEIYPGDYTDQMSERSREWMMAGGHTSRNFNPMLTAVTSSEAPWDPSNEFIAYTMPAHEFRRILDMVRMESSPPQQQSFVIEYTQLFGLGDETWRSTAIGTADTRTIRLEEDLANGQRSCHVMRVDHKRINSEGGTAKRIKTSELCGANDLPNLPPLPFWAQKLLLFEPYPILPGDYKLHCFGP